MINKQELLKHFNNKDEKILFSKVLDQVILCVRNYETTFTDFLPISNVIMFLKILDSYRLDINTKIFGGFEDSERVIIGFSPEFLELENSDFPLEVIKINYNHKYSKSLTHRDFLGSILGLGISRTKVGDIIINQEDVFCFVDKEISDYLITNLLKVGSTSVTATKVDYKNYTFTLTTLKEKVITVSSIRLDTVLSSAFNISRAKSLSLIKAEKVFVNWISQTNSSKTLNEGDSVTLRGFGKIKINEIKGRTKKDKIILSIFSTK